jgi:hypothetical protein
MVVVEMRDSTKIDGHEILSGDATTRRQLVQQGASIWENFPKTPVGEIQYGMPSWGLGACCVLRAAGGGHSLV